METRENMKEILNYLQSEEGEQFIFDEDAIIGEDQKNNANKSGLAIKMLSVLGGSLATLAFMGFLSITGLYYSGPGMLLFGIVFIFGSVWLNSESDKIIIDTFSVFTFIIGNALIGFGLSLLNVDVNIISLIFTLIALFSLSTVQNYILSFISVLMVNASILMIILNNRFDLIHIYISILSLVLTYFFLNEAKIIRMSKRLSKLYIPIRIGVILSFLSALVFVGKRGLISISPEYIWLSSIATIVSTLYLISILFEIMNIKAVKNRIIIYSISFILLLPTSFSPAISGSILVILLSFFVNYKTGFVLGIISCIYFISQYYYDLHFTLLIKSGILFLSGTLFILLYLFVNIKLTTNEQV